MTLPSNPEELGERIASAAKAFHGESKPVDVMRWMVHVMLLLDRMKEHRDWLRGVASVVREDDFGLRLKRAEQLYVEWTEVMFNFSANEVGKALDDPPQSGTDDKVGSLLKACRDVKFRTCGMAIGPATVDSETMRKMFEALKQFEDQNENIRDF